MKTNKNENLILELTPAELKIIFDKPVVDLTKLEVRIAIEAINSELNIRDFYHVN